MSRISVFQPLYFLLLASPEVASSASEAIDAWEKRTGFRMPGALREFYSTDVTMPLDEDQEERHLWSEPDPEHRIAGTVDEDRWTISLHGLWREYWEGEFAPLDPVLHAFERAFGGARVDELEALAPPPDEWKPLVFLETDVMRIHRAFVELDGSDDPPIVEHSRENGAWVRTSTTFSQWFFRFIVDASTTQSNVPYSFWGPRANHDASVDCAPVMLFRNGLWLRALGAPLTPSARERLAARLEHHADDGPNDTRIDRFSADNGLIQVVTDTEGTEEARSAWWIGAEDADALTALVRAARETEALTASLLADTDRARAVLARL